MTDLEKADKWLAERKLNSYGDPESTMYMGGSPLFNESTGESKDRYKHLKEKYTDLPWLTVNKSTSTTTTTSTMKQIILFTGNAVIHSMWFRVLYILLSTFASTSSSSSGDIGNIHETFCLEKLRPCIIQALMVSTIELFNSIFGLTKSKPHQVLLFTSVRTGVELIAAPHLPCNSYQHLITIVCWSLDGIVRFGCFALDAIFSILGYNSVTLIKSIRYTVGPMLFPLGAGGEMAMVITIAYQTGKWPVWVAASLWPLGFYPLMKQLLKQRKRHFQKLSNDKQKKDL
mmetsp:Transcript_15163/g.18464  ORF Transcript_15163/g.18464 Transcript_15163/m.18464 type:complete len:287 (-) Transcript_15163:18-878(-)